jgi:cysteine desulfurase
MCEDYGNPSSLHKKGVIAEQYIKEAKENFAKIWKCDSKEIYFTSGGTEGDNWALRGVAYANKRRGMHLITTQIEHPAIINTMLSLEEEGFRVTYLPVDKYGAVSLCDLKNALCEETILVSIMHVNNEVGTVQPIEEMGQIIKDYNEKIYFHVDAVQGFGKISLIPKVEKVDLISVSGHKIHAPKGVGVLYINSKVKIKPIIFGGGHQNGLRSGTENVPGIAGIGLAAKKINHRLNEKAAEISRLSDKLIKGILEIEGTVIHGANANKMDCPTYASACNDEILHKSAPHIVSAGFVDISSEVLLHALEEEGIYVSSGSACASNHPNVSGVLESMNVSDKYLKSTLRFSLSEFTTEEEIDVTLEKLKALVPKFRRYTRR